MDDVTALMQGFIEEVIRRKKAESVAQNTLDENKRLAAQVAAWEKAHPEGLPAEAPNG